VTLSVRSRLWLASSAVFGVLLSLVGAIAYRVFAHQLDADATSTLVEKTSGLHGYLRFQAGLPILAFNPNDPVQAAFVYEATRYYQVYDAISGTLLVQSDAIESMGLAFTLAQVRQLAARPQIVDLRTDYGRLRLSNTLIVPRPGEAYLLQVGNSLDPMDRALGRLLVLLVTGVPLGLLGLVIVGKWSADYALAPLLELAVAADRVDINDLGRRLPVRGVGDEVDEVAHAFNDTLGRLEHAIGEMRQFGAALAHELRTPLAVLRADIETGLGESRAGRDIEPRLAGQLEEIDKLKRLIDQLLTLARADAGEIRLERAPVDVGELSGAISDQLELVAQAKRVTLRCEAADRVIVHGDRSWLERLLLNLLDNAIKFTPEGGAVGIRVSRDGAMARIEVRDTGVGMSRDQLPHVFERFYRADPSRSSSTEGVGLGLSLAKWIVDRHGGTIDATSEPGHGSTFTVRLPADTPATLP
jgi:heavy metal sensor kinase